MGRGCPHHDYKQLQRKVRTGKEPAPKVKYESLIGWRGDEDEGIKVAHLKAIGDYDARREMVSEV